MERLLFFAVLRASATDRAVECPALADRCGLRFARGSQAQAVFVLETYPKIVESYNPWRFFLRQIVGYYHEELIYVWSDRLCASEWLSRSRLEGETDLILGRNRNRPVVLASLPFGPYETFPYLLRAHGIPTTMIRGLAGPPLFRGKIRL